MADEENPDKKEMKMSMNKFYPKSVNSSILDEVLGSFRPMWDDFLHKDQESCGRYADDIEEVIPLPRNYNERNVEDGPEMGDH